MITVIGIFDDLNLAEEASSYLVANEFLNENIDLHPQNEQTDNEGKISDFFSHLIDDEKQAAHFATIAQKGNIVTVHALSAREAQEAVDVLNNYGAVEVSANDGAASRGHVIERIVAGDKRLRGF